MFAYAWIHHASLLVKAKVVAGEIDAVRTAPLHAMGEDEERGLSKDLWTVTRYIDTMTKDVKALDDGFEEIRRGLSERRIVEGKSPSKSLQLCSVEKLRTT